MKTNLRPIILLLGAKSTHSPLPSIPEELRILKSIFEAYQTEDLPQFEIKYEPYFTQKYLKTWLDDFSDRIAILHFAGHSDPNSIQTDDSFVRAEDIATHIQTWTRRPDLIFLNGCKNNLQAQNFLDAGVSAVIATRHAVNDKLAVSFAQEYYRSFLSQDGRTTLFAALEQARAKLRLKKGHIERSIELDEEEIKTNQWNWNILFNNAEKADLSLFELLTIERPRYGANGYLINPYQGLAAFKETDRDFFFGREQLTEELINTIYHTPFLALLGSSGSGKSSLINAGIIPRIRQSRDFLIFKSRPGNDPFEELARCIAKHLYPNKSQLQLRIQQSKDLAKKLQSAPEYLSELMQFCLHDSGKNSLIIFIDQFEELFTHIESELAKKTVRQYEIALGKLVANSDGNIKLVLAMRADFLGIALTHRHLAIILSQYSNSTKYLSPMNSAELRSVILAPAGKQGVSVEDGLTNQLLNELDKNTESLPLLQHVLSLVWQSRNSSKLKLVDYTRLGGIATALETQADRFLANLATKEQKDQVKLIFLRLINLGERQNDTRRRADMTEFDSQAEPLIQQLTQQRLIATQGGHDPKSAFVEISHEALIKSWGSLKEWINENRNQLQIQHQISKAAKDWHENGRDDSWLLNGARLSTAQYWLKENKPVATDLEKDLLNKSKSKEEKKQKRQFHITASVIILLSAFAIFAGFQWNIARINAEVAEKNAEDARQKELQATKEKLKSNYNLAKAFEEKSLFSISRGNNQATGHVLGSNSKNEYRKALLYALETQRHPLPIGAKTLLYTAFYQLSNLPNSTWNTFKFDTSYLLGKTKKEHSSQISSLVYSSDGKVIKSRSQDGAVRLWDVASSTLMTRITDTKYIPPPADARTFATGKAVSGLEIVEQTYDPKGKFVASGTEGGYIKIWNLKSGELIHNLEWHSDRILALAYSADGKIISSGSSDKTIRSWNAETGEIISVIDSPSEAVSALAYSPDGKTLTFGLTNGAIRYWKLQPHQSANKVEIEIKKESDVRGFSFSPDSQTIVSSTNNVTRLWDTITGENIKNFNKSYSNPTYSPDGKTIAGNNDKFVFFLDSQTGLPVQHNGRQFDIKLYFQIKTFKYSPDNRLMAIATSGHNIDLWNVKSGDNIPYLDIKSGLTRYSLNGDKDQKEKNYDSLGRDIRVINDLAFSPDSKTIASGSSDSIIRIWSIESGKIIRYLEGHALSVKALSYSPDGKNIASSSGNTIRLWSTQSGKTIKVLEAQEADILTLNYSPDGKFIASGSKDGSIILWDAQSGEIINTFHDSGKIWQVAFSPDGKFIASESDAGIRLRRHFTKSNPILRLLHDFKVSEVSNALRFLWDLELYGLEFKNNPSSEFPHSKMIDHKTWTDKTLKYRQLLNMPEGDDTKMEQVIHWLEKRCAYRQPEVHSCKPVNDSAK